MPEGISPTPEKNNEDGLMGKASEFFRNLTGKGGEGTGLKGDPEAEARLSEERDKSAADLEAYRQQRREQIGIQNQGESNADDAADQTQEAPTDIDKAA